LGSTAVRRAWQRHITVITVASAVAALAVAAPAAGEPASRPRSGTVSAGDARFQVLSPTLVRTEYAGDGKFLDAPTFNAIGRTDFTPPPFTATTVNGWLTIRTSALTVRYQVGSGPFTARNLEVRTATTTAAPWQQLTCPAGALCEAEELPFTGLALATDHTGATGSGFVAGFEGTGNALTADVEAATAGDYQFDTRYANSAGGDGQTVTRTLTLTVDGGAPRAVQLPVTANWDSWAVQATSVHLEAGRHTIALTRTATDSGNVNVDSVALVSPGAAYPSTATKAIVDCRFGVSCEAEAGRAVGSAITATDHAGFAGRGFVAELNQGTSLTQRVVSVPADGTYALQVRYANGVGGDGQHQTRTATVTSGGVPQTISLPATDNWDTWGTASVPIALKAGTNDVTIGCPEAASCHVNLDTVAVASPGTAVAPHLALGGYRRGLDGFNGDNGDPKTVPGLLYRDGWALIDDTPSAVYANGTATPRGNHGGKPYRDGYVFGYGHDYKQSLQDLATLTGPPELLPRWAYGVWYSEYIDRTAADYQNTIVPRFRAEGVPLDVLVTDTDFKAPATWNGWEIDRAKFPDPKAFFDWSHAQGLHNTLNTHPSIQGSDPQFAQAQATAKGKLAKDCGADCYTFDWGDPDQLQAYFGLHRTMDQQGADFWWLDWCCDASKSTLDGVTPDAWINQKYAEDSAANIGRGFVTSRAYGSLQAGGYGNPAGLPTGPWADKRSTVHFTGDTSSTWGTLRAEVGYTPGEAAATGMSAISHDIGGHNDTTGLPGAETYTSGGQTQRTAKLPDDLYARWVQLGTFQPIDRLHSNHSDRLPWQYGPAAKASAEKFLNLRENLVPYTYSLAEQATATGVPVTRPLYLEYPEEADAYRMAGSEYLYGPDMLVAPVTTPGDTATTTVWFPPGQWTDYFTGKTYAGGTTQAITTDLSTMPVFVKAGAIVPTRTANVTDDTRNPLSRVTVTVAAGASGSYKLYEDNGTSTAPGRGATTTVRYTEAAGRHTLRIDPAAGSFPGQVKSREWTVKVIGGKPPTSVSGGATYRWDSATSTLTLTLPAANVHRPITVTYR
jgi:hypothetical protein